MKAGQLSFIAIICMLAPPNCPKQCKTNPKCTQEDSFRKQKLNKTKDIWSKNRHLNCNCISHTLPTTSSKRGLCRNKEGKKTKTTNIYNLPTENMEDSILMSIKKKKNRQQHKHQCKNENLFTNSQ